VRCFGSDPAAVERSTAAPVPSGACSQCSATATPHPIAPLAATLGAEDASADAFSAPSVRIDRPASMSEALLRLGRAERD
jgi:hypothetical protein